MDEERQNQLSGAITEEFIQGRTFWTYKEVDSLELEISIYYMNLLPTISKIITMLQSLSYEIYSQKSFLLIHTRA